MVTCVLLATWNLAARGQGQEFGINFGSITTCNGMIEDTGGPNGEYGNDEHFVLTVCPDMPGNVIQLNWLVFDLDTAGGPDDFIEIHDGEDTNAPTLGTYTWHDLQNIVVSATAFNTSGCLTLEWWSNGSGTGQFAAGIQCSVPCDHPTAAASMSEPSPLLACMGEPIFFDGSSSYAAQGFNIEQYVWDFGDGNTDSTSGPLVSHQFADHGEYMVHLTVTDDNGCSSLNGVDLHVLISTQPDFSGTSDDMVVCAGQPVELIGQAQPVTWTASPDAGFSEPQLLPDDVGVPIQAGILYEDFEPGSLVDDVNDLTSVCLDIEHSFMGDLVLQVICPNGQTTFLHQQGGGATYLGDANDLDVADPEPGTCWTYCWSPTASNGTMVENSATNTVPTSQGIALEPGTYEAVGSFNELLGCPLNGLWVFQCTDLWSSDNGFMCNWTINWDPALLPSATTFTPTIGPGIDSSLWSGGTAPDEISTNGDTIVFSTNEAGTYPFIYTVTDNFGCTYQTTVEVTIVVPDTPVINVNGTLLWTTGGIAYQWFFNGEPVPEGDGPTLDLVANGSYMVQVTDLNGCTATSAEHFIQLGLEDVHERDMLRIWPVPSRNAVNLDLPLGAGVDALVELVDAHGRLVRLEHGLDSRHIIDVSDLSSGLYRVVITDRSARWIGTLMVE